MNVKFLRYSEMSKPERDKTDYIKMKRFVLRLEMNPHWRSLFEFSRDSSILSYAMKYYDFESEPFEIFKDRYNHVPGFYDRGFSYAITDLLFSLYNQDRGFFQTFLSFIFKEAKDKIPDDCFLKIRTELITLGYFFDGDVLKITSGEPIIEAKMKSIIEEELQKINPKLLEIRKGALEALLSNESDKARHVSTSCRALINNLLEELVPEVKTKEEESKIQKRIETIFKKSESTSNLVNETAHLIQALQKVQSKGDHAFIDESLSHFIFQMTENLIYFILMSR